MKKFYWLWLVIGALVVSKFVSQHGSSAKKEGSNSKLTEEQARKRASQVSDVHYKLFFNLASHGTEYSGQVILDFKMKDPSQNLRIDFTDGTITESKVNGKKTPLNYNGEFVTVEPKLLKRGNNTITLDFRHVHSKTGNGFYRFEDPQDKRVYTYTNFEPFHANHLFPNFDQPNLKASYELEVNAPAKWIVVTSSRENSVRNINRDRKLWSFPKTKRYSTYIFPLHAGEYKVWEDKAGDIPLRLMARHSLADKVPVQDWFKQTKLGFEFFQNYFDYKYPFTKFDQLLVPDFNWGGMENVGAVTYSERFAPSTKKRSRHQRRRLAGIIMHEMAHMWFGNLVTMHWWDDLWLNESFASYMASLALAEQTEFKEAWQSFYQGMKQWAYWEDQLVTTHAITTAVPTTDDAFANFDGITYGKGAATLKQLAYRIGPDKFRDGLRTYFKKHEYGNTRLKDFIAALEKSSASNLSEFTSSWLQTKGLNLITADFKCKNRKISNFAVVQKGDLLRTHATEIALYRKENSGNLVSFKQLKVNYDGARTEIKPLVGSECPSFVNLNANDHDYVKIKLDPVSLATVKKSLSRFTSDFERTMLWQNLWDMTRDAELDIYTYENLVHQHIGAESDLKILRSVVQTVSGSNPYRASLLHYIPHSYQNSYHQKWEGFLLSNLQSASEGSDAQMFWFDQYIALAASKNARSRLANYLAGKNVPKGFSIDQDRRWKLIIKLAQYNQPKIKSLIGKEGKTDRSHRAKISKLAAEAIIPSLNSKEKWFAKLNDEKLKYAERRAIARVLFPRTQKDLHIKFQDRYFNQLPKMIGAHDMHWLETYAEMLMPRFCTNASLRRLKRFSKTKFPAYVSKVIKVGAQEEERCVKIRELAGKSKQSS